MERATRKKIEWAFYNYNKLKEENAQLLEEIATAGLTIDFSKVGNGSDVGNPTEQKVIRFSDYENALWCAVVERTYIHYKWAMEGFIIKKKYFEKLRRRDIMKLVEAGESTYHFWLNKILTTAELWAYEFKLVK